MVYSMSKVVLYSSGLVEDEKHFLIYVIFGIILYKYNNIIDKYLLGKNA
jgi:hypothetical protein